MAEETKTIETTETNTETKGPTVEELMAQLATAKADAEKYKSANDKLSKSEAEMKRQLRAKQTAEEQEEEAKRIADEERDSMRKELNHIKAMNAYKAISDEKTVDKLIEAVSESDHNAIAQIIDAECKKAVKNAESEWLKDRPRVQHGQYTGMSVEQIMSITDPAERVRAIAQNNHLF